MDENEVRWRERRHCQEQGPKKRAEVDYIRCEVHGRQVRDSLTGGCIMCGVYF